MNKTILLTCGAQPAIRQAADFFAASHDRVYLSAPARPENMADGIRFLPFDPMHKESLAQAVKEIERQSGQLDILVLGTGRQPHDGKVGAGHDYDEMLDTMMQNLFGAFEPVNPFLPLLRRGMKRIAAITDIEASNSYSTGQEDFAASASKAALNMMGKILFNKLRPEGFTFRWYCDIKAPEAMQAGEYITSALCYDEKEPYIHSDENRFVLRDGFLREIPW